jgi:hypothetical protein
MVLVGLVIGRAISKHLHLLGFYEMEFDKA